VGPLSRRDRKPRSEPVQVRVVNRQRKFPLDRVRTTEVATFLLEEMGQSGAELSVAFVSDRTITRLNRTYLGRSHPTDVMAFSQREGEGGALHPSLLGDVIISTETAAVQATEEETCLSEELDVLLVHGILHLLGYEHTRSREDALRMSRKQAELVRKVRNRYPATGLKRSKAK